MFLKHFELTATTAHCSVPMPKHPSDKAHLIDVPCRSSQPHNRRTTHHYLYHYSYPRLSISAAATYLVDRHDALAS